MINSGWRLGWKVINWVWLRIHIRTSKVDKRWAYSKPKVSLSFGMAKPLNIRFLAFGWAQNWAQKQTKCPEPSSVWLWLGCPAWAKYQFFQQASNVNTNYWTNVNTNYWNNCDFANLSLLLINTITGSHFPMASIIIIRSSKIYI